MLCRSLLLLQTLGFGALTALASKCNPAAFKKILPTNAAISYAISNGPNSTFGNPADIAYPTNATNLPPFCAMLVNVTTSPSSFFTFGLWLPEKWNERFLAVGNGGFAGGVNFLDMGAGLHYGFAVISTDTGHNSSSFDISWALDQPEKQIDWGYRAMHGSIVLAKEIITAYYSCSIKYSYYSGCSTGGRQGLKDIQFYPEDFDGVLAGAPAWWTTHLAAWTLKIGTYNIPPTSATHIPTTLFPVISAEVFRQCDGIDGLTDGIITDPARCDFHPETLICTPSSNTSECLTSPQLDTLYLIYNNYVDTNQTFVFPHLELGSEAQWPILLGGSTPNPLGTAYFQDFLGLGANWPFTDYTYATLQQADALDPGNATADDFDLSPFHRHGGKLLQYHGQADGLIATGSSIYFYNHVLRTLVPKGIELDSWYRFFLVPGMQHCAGSVNNAPWYFAGANQAGMLGTGVYSVPGFSDARHDALLALMQWVEEGVAPERIVATKFVNDTVSLGVVRQRPLCVYPKISTYVGGNANVASNFVCA
ncbi:hypothetical protein MMC19_004828 [Ptychographa xylographoides]|nr:hypothetical protein [Ptychographa xylographoides]